MSNILSSDWMHIDSCIPKVDKVVKFWTGEKEFVGLMDCGGSIFVYHCDTDMDYHSDIEDGYVTHWKERHIL